MVQRLLLDSEVSLEVAAQATGFSGSMHLIRTEAVRPDAGPSGGEHLA